MQSAHTEGGPDLVQCWSWGACTTLAAPFGVLGPAFSSPATAVPAMCFSGRDSGVLQPCTSRQVSAVCCSRHVCDELSAGNFNSRQQFGTALGPKMQVVQCCWACGAPGGGLCVLQRPQRGVHRGEAGGRQRCALGRHRGRAGRPPPRRPSL